MGEIADMIIEGAMCPCGEIIGDEAGYPRFCSTRCERDYGGSEQVAAQTKLPKTVLCREHPHCERRFRTAGAERQHWIDKHDAAQGGHGHG